MTTKKSSTTPAARLINIAVDPKLHRDFKITAAQEQKTMRELIEREIRRLIRRYEAQLARRTAKEAIR